MRDELAGAKEPSAKAAKAALRREVRLRLSAMTAATRQAESAKACELLRQQRVWHDAESILFFAPLPQELDVWPLLLEALAAGKTVALPRFEPKTQRYGPCEIRTPATDLVRGQFGIREPGGQCRGVAINRLDLVLVPGVAFDLHGRRLGRGKGFYDQFLAAVRGTTCGVAFDEQIVRRVPVEPHDIHLNCILTPTRWREL